MQNLYETAWGWDDTAKRRELAHADARFLLASDASGQLQAFCHFRQAAWGPA